MTLSSETARNDYTLNGSTTVWPYTFRILSPADLKVVRRPAGGAVEVTLVPDSEYTVSGAGSAEGGSVTLASPGAFGDAISILRDPALTQPTQLTRHGAYSPHVIEEALDRLAAQVQALADQLKRAPRLGETVAAAADTMGRPTVAGQVPVVSATLDRFELATLDAAAYVALPGEGRTAATATAYLQNNRLFNVLDYAPAGVAIHTGANDARAAIAATDAAARAVGAAVYFPPGTYRVDSSLAVTSPVVALAGARIRPASSRVTLTLRREPYAGRVQVFDVSAGGVVRFAYPTEVFAEWFGLTPNDGSAGARRANDAAMKAAIESMGRVAQPGGPSAGRFPAGSVVSVGWGIFYFGASVHMNTACRLRGVASSPYIQATVFSFPLGVHGIVVHYDNDTGDASYGWAGHGVIESIVCTTAGGGSAAAWHGCEVRATVHLIRCAFHGFQGNGINIDADVNEARPNNANLFHLTHCRAIGNVGHGLYVNGGDANAGLVELFDAQDNGGWGIYDSSFLGNTYVACHAANNRLGAYKTDDPNGRSVFVGCYSESGQPASSFVAPTVVVGGLHGAGISTSGISLLDSIASAPVVSTARLYTTRVPTTAVAAGGTISLSALALPPNGTGIMLVRCGVVGDEGQYIVGNNGNVAATVVPVRATPRVRIVVSGTDIVITNATGAGTTMSAVIQGMNPE